MDYLTVLLIISVGFSQGSRLEYQFQGIIKSSRHTLLFPEFDASPMQSRYLDCKLSSFIETKWLLMGTHCINITRVERDYASNVYITVVMIVWWNGFRIHDCFFFPPSPIRKNELRSTINRDQNILSHDNNLLKKKIIDEPI